MIGRAGRVVAFCLAVTAAAQWGASAGEPVPGSAAPPLQVLIAQALERSQELYALRDRVVAAGAMIRPAGALPDPMAQVGYQNIPVGEGVRLDRDMMSSVMLMLSQELPPPSRRRLLREGQSAEVVMLLAQLADKRNETVREVKQAYYDVQYRDEARAMAEANRDIAQDMLAAAEARYAAGKVMQQDVFQAQVRLSQMVDMVVMQRQERAMAATRLNRLLYRDATAEIPRLSPLRLSGIRFADLRARVEAGNPRLAEMRARVVQAEKATGVAASMLKPELTLSLAYMIRAPLPDDPMSGDDMWSALVGINLPWVYRRDKTDEEVRSAEAARGAAERDLSAMRNELVAMAEEMAIDAARAEEQLALVETGLIPQAEGAYAASRASYSSGLGDILSLLDNQMNFYNLQLQRAMLLRDRERAMAEVEYLTGGARADAPQEGAGG